MRKRYQFPVILLLALALLNCGPDDVSKVKKKVADAAEILNTAAKSNRSLYQSGVYGPVGSSEAIEKRQKVAQAIHAANEYLALAVEIAANLTASDLDTDKADIVRLLQEAATLLGQLNVGNEDIQLIIASAVTAINSAVTLTLAIKGGN